MRWIKKIIAWLGRPFDPWLRRRKDDALADLDAKRRAEAGSDPVVNALCAELEQIAARKMGRIVGGLHREWSW